MFYLFIIQATFEDKIGQLKTVMESAEMALDTCMQLGHDIKVSIFRLK